MTTLLSTSGFGLTRGVASQILPWLSPGSPTHVFHTTQAKSSPSASVDMQMSDVVAEATFKHKNLASLVSELKAESGLTADQLGRLLGVSRRSVHNWAAGSSVAARHEERVRELSALVFGLDAKSPDERRAILLDSSHGRSLFKQFMEDGSQPQRVQYPVSVEERFGL